MTLADLFIIESTRNSVEAAGCWRAPAVSVFTSCQSLAFPLATSVVTTVARASRTIGHTDFDSIVVPLLAAGVVGTLMVILTVANPRARPRTWTAWLVMIAVAAVNTLLLFVAALGIEKF